MNLTFLCIILFTNCLHCHLSLFISFFLFLFLFSYNRQSGEVRIDGKLYCGDINRSLPKRKDNNCYSENRICACTRKYQQQVRITDICFIFLLFLIFSSLFQFDIIALRFLFLFNYCEPNVLSYIV